MKVGIYTNKEKDSKLTYTNKLIELLTLNNIQYICVNDTKDYDDIDLIIVLGGDGTMLKVGMISAEKNISVLGINIGNLGFLTEFEGDELNDAVQFIKNKNWKIDSRTILQAKINDNIFYSINECVVQRISLNDDCQIVNLTASINDNIIDVFKCDGLIVSTPTGSTAYSLSAGGAILAPDINAFNLTPICAHSLHNKPIVFSGESTIKIKNNGKSEGLALICDGKMKMPIHFNDIVEISKSNFKLNFLRKENSSFYHKLMLKLNKWSME